MLNVKMITQKSNRMYQWTIIGLCLSMWVWLSIAPEHAVSWICFGLALVGLAGQNRLARVLYTGLITILMWCLAYTQHEPFLINVVIFLAALGPVSYAIQMKDGWNKAYLFGACWLWVEYICALSMVSSDTYMILRRCVLPISVCVCWLQYPQWSVRIATHIKKHAWGVNSNVLVGIILSHFFLIWSCNTFDTTAASGLNKKHRILWMGVCALPVLWKLFDLKQCWTSRTLTVGLAGLIYGAHSRLGLIAVVGAFCTRYLLLTRPKFFFMSVSTVWGAVSLGTVFWFQYCLNHAVIIMIGSLNSSFYERLIFWRHFGVYADEVFWWGYGIPNFLRILFKPLSYTGIDHKILTTLPSHTHWLWLDLRLSIGCVGVAAVTIALLGTFMRYRHYCFTPQQATKLATLVYTSILYTSFYGIFWHIFVLAWLFFSWLITDFLYQNVLRGTEKNTLNFRSTWNNVQGAFYAKQEK